MTTRRRFIRNSVLAGTAIGAGLPSFAMAGKRSWVTNRPDIKQRRFLSNAVEETIKEIKSYLGDNELAWLFENCFPNTLDTTVFFREKDNKPDTFVITGDIHAMWLRDSTAQVWPYISLIDSDKNLQALVAGVINRQVKCIMTDPYANAFNDGPAESPWKDDLTDMKPELHERKWEIDSLCYPVRLSYGYWKKSGDASVFDTTWKEAMTSVIKTFRQQQRKENRGPYKFQRVTGWQSDTVAGGGYGNPVVPVGLIVSIFRPSDDATIWPFLIPSNYFAVKSLHQIAEIAEAVLKDDTLKNDAIALADEVETALKKYAVATHPLFGNVIPYETDGYRNFNFMDDANVPSLLSMPYLETIDSHDPLYINTREFVLSNNNPYYFQGVYGSGIGSPHTGADRIWPISLTIRALTATNEEEVVSALKTLKATHAGTGFMHESFMKDDPSRFTRKWFAWANTIFGELVLTTYRNNPELLREV